MNSRDHIRSHIANIQSFDTLEDQHRVGALDWIDSGQPLFRIKSPDVPPKHLVAYFVVIDPEHRSMLLCDHIKAQLWLPTGGHVKPSETPRQTVIRESQEELARPASFLRGNDRPFFVTVTPTGGLVPGHTDVSLWYLLRGNVHDYTHYEKREFNDVAWFSFDEILESDPVI